MKKDPSSNEKKILKFLLEQQLPEAQVPGAAGSTSGSPSKATTNPLADDTISVTAVDHVAQVALETCRCVHLQEHLPHLLDLELCRSVHHPRGWVVANPVHSMHLQTQLEDSVPALAHNKQPPVLYGEEQQRTMALNTEGIVEHWCPLDGYSAVIHDDTAMEKMEHMPTLHNIDHAAVIPRAKHQHHQYAPLSSSHSVEAGMAMPPPAAIAQPSKVTSAMGMAPPEAPISVSSTSAVSGASTSTTVPTGITNNNKGVQLSEAPKSGAAGNVSKPVNNRAQPDEVVSEMKHRNEIDNISSVIPVAVPMGEGPTSASHYNENMASTAKNTGAEAVQTDEIMTDETPNSAENEMKTTEGSSDSGPPSTVAAKTTKDTNFKEVLADPSKFVSKPDAAADSKEGELEKSQSNIESIEKNDTAPAMEEGNMNCKAEEVATKDDKKDSLMENAKNESAVKEENKDISGSTQEWSEDPVVAPGKEDDNTDGNTSNKDEDVKNAKSDGVVPKKSDEEMADVSKEGLSSAEDSSKMDGNTKAQKMDRDDLEAETGTGTLEGVQKAHTDKKSPEQPDTEKKSDDVKKDEEADNKRDVERPPKDNDIGPSQAPALLGGDSASVPTIRSDAAVPPPSIGLSGANDGAAVLPASGSSLGTRADNIPLALSEEKFNHLRIEEDRIRLIRRSLSSHRILPKKKADPKKRIDPKKKRKREDLYTAHGIPGWHASNLKELTQEQEDQWHEAMVASRTKVQQWMENFRVSRETYWDEKICHMSSSPGGKDGNFDLPTDRMAGLRCCETCSARPSGDKYWDGVSKKSRKPRRRYFGDELMQCLECNFVGCSPKSVSRDSKQHILEHLLISGHKFAVTCGERGQLFCFCCGDFVYHEVFEQEKARIDYGKKIPLMAWKPHQLYRSFDPFHFMKTLDHGIVWRGLVATYPQLVPNEHIWATEWTLRRQALFRGKAKEKCLASRPHALKFAASQSQLGQARQHRISKPVGMYNLGNTCYKSAVLQCLIHCQPLQRFFLKENGHHHHACKLYRQREASRRKKKKTASRPDDYICLACEMDRLILTYYGSTTGMDVLGAVEEACSHDDADVMMDDSLEQGDPLVISEMLTASWKTEGMNGLAGYKQHDSHEFLNSFLEMVGKQTKQHWSRVQSAINVVKTDNAVVEDENDYPQDVVQKLFEGSLSSVLLCEECGKKRKRTEEFLNVSLSLSEQFAMLESTGEKPTLSVETCLERFVTPEKLGDCVNCPSCDKKTATQKQHTFGTLPKVLCLHLKRFDAALNRKIDDFVSFPSKGLNMGKYLAQWCEVTSLRTSQHGCIAEPHVYYDLFGTVNHIGSMTSGHYVTNVKVNDDWYHFNDAHVSLAGGDGGDETVITSSGAYILFYVRREGRSVSF